MEGILKNILEITQYMRQNMNKGISIEELAAHFSYSKFYFSREFKKQVGASPNEFWAALRIEQMYLQIKETDSILHSQLSSGYLSSGTFSNTFLKSTGMTPSVYKKNLDKFYNAMQKYEHIDTKTYSHYSFNEKDYRNLQQYTATIHIKTPENFEGTIFVGLFDKPISNRPPIVGKAMFAAKSVVINCIPPGAYYVLSVAIPKHSLPVEYFHLDNALRAIDREPIVFPLRKNQEIVQILRKKVADDPPITINPVKLLLNAIKKGNVE